MSCCGDPGDCGESCGTIVSNDDCWTLLEKAWAPMHEQGVHVHARGWRTAADGPIDGVVVVARGQAARMIHRFVDEHVPPFEGQP